MFPYDAERGNPIYSSKVLKLEFCCCFWLLDSLFEYKAPAPLFPMTWLMPASAFSSWPGRPSESMKSGFNACVSSPSSASVFLLPLLSFFLFRNSAKRGNFDLRLPCFWSNAIFSVCANPRPQHLKAITLNKVVIAALLDFDPRRGKNGKRVRGGEKLEENLIPRKNIQIIPVRQTRSTRKPAAISFGISIVCLYLPSERKTS